jgi:hypothetical protein
MRVLLFFNKVATLSRYLPDSILLIKHIPSAVLFAIHFSLHDSILLISIEMAFFFLKK